jgi:two-component system, NtrC family, response regulator
MADSRPKLLVVEDDPGLQTQLKWCFDEYEVLVAGDRAEALAQLRRHEPPVVLQDLGLPPDATGATEGLRALTETLSIAPLTKVIVVTGNHDRENALRAVEAGAYDFYQKPVDADVLKLIVSRAFYVHSLEHEARQWREARLATPLDGIVANDEKMLAVCRTIEKVAPTAVSVLILGESGTGKELLARALHKLGDRSRGPFVAINCAAIPEQLLESELFGHEKGAFTGAIKQSIGKFEVASGGTLFLDEIGDMPLSLQAKLLRFLQSRVIERVGGRAEIPIDVRIVCATNRDLQQLIAEQKFRQDLYYRIAEVTVLVPALRDRAGGAVLLAHAMLRRYGALQGRSKRGFTEEALAAIDAHDWPGNVRELENKVKTALIMSEGPLVTAADVGLAPAQAAMPLLTIKEVRARAESHAVRQALQICDGQITRAAEMLGVTRPTLYELMDRYKLRGAAT